MIKELEIVKEKTLTNNLENARNPDMFDLKIREYPFGKRMSFVLKEQNVDLFEDLQNSRGITVEQDSTIESVIESIKKDIELSELDLGRINELDFLKLDLSKFSEHVEIGFRSPRLLKFYSDKGLHSTGIDISHLNVEVCKKLGFNAVSANIALENVELPKINGHCLVTCYHVIEHTHDPLLAIKNIKKMMPLGSLLHIEVPIEPGVPRLKYGHMSEFHTNDLKELLLIAGFDVVVVTAQSSMIDRCIAFLKE